MSNRICWECPFTVAGPTCDPNRARCPEPPLPAAEQERIARRYDEWRGAWVVHDGLPPLPIGITSAPVTDNRTADVRRTIEIDIEDGDL